MMEVRTDGSMQVELASEGSHLRSQLRILPSADHFQTSPACIDEVLQQRAKLRIGHAVLRRMREHSDTARGLDPLHDRVQGRPHVTNVSGFAGTEILAERRGRIFHSTGLYKVSREMWSTDRGIAGASDDSVETVIQSGFDESIGYPAGAPPPNRLLGLDRALQCRAVRVDVEANDVNAAPHPAGREFDASDQFRSAAVTIARSAETCDRVVIRNGEHVDAIRRGEAEQIIRRQRTVGCSRVRVKVVDHCSRLYGLRNSAGFRHGMCENDATSAS